MLPESLRTFLAAHHARYRVRRGGLPRLARTVLVRALTHPPGQLLLVVLPHDAELDLGRLHEILGFPVELAPPTAPGHVFPAGATGALPPIGELAMGPLPVFVDVSLSRAPVVAFPVGAEGELIEMTWDEFNRISRHKLIECTRGHAGA